MTKVKTLTRSDIADAITAEFQVTKFEALEFIHDAAVLGGDDRRDAVVGGTIVAWVIKLGAGKEGVKAALGQGQASGHRESQQGKEFFHVCKVLDLQTYVIICSYTIRSVTILHSPGFKLPSVMFPICTRIRRSVGNPTAAVMCRTCLFLPSIRVILIQFVGMLAR